MPDIEKAIKGLHQHCEGSMFDRCGECPYYDVQNEPFICRDMLLNDLNALLKEQEAVEPETEVLNEIDRLYRCPKCHKYFFYRGQKYCDRCGQAVKWE